MPKTPHLPSEGKPKSDKRTPPEADSLTEIEKDGAVKVKGQLGRSSMLRRPVTPNNNTQVGYRHQNKMPLTDLERELLEMSYNEEEQANASKQSAGRTSNQDKKQTSKAASNSCSYQE